jgi:imidazolonepropionase-like amidohydrolase
MLPFLMMCAGVLAHPTPTPLADGPGQTPQRFAIRAHRIHAGDGAAIENGVLLVEGGKITAVGKDVAVPPDAFVVEHPGDVTAGCIALHDESGGDGELVDSTRVELADSRVSRGLNSSHSDFGRLVAEGITSVVLGGSDEVLCGGQTAVVKTAGGVVVRDPAHLELSFAAAALNYGRFPTSYGGAVGELDARMKEGKGVFGMAHRGELPVLIAADAKHEVLRALDFVQRNGLKGALLGASLAGELAAQVKASGLSVVWKPFDASTTQRELDALVLLSRAEVPFGFALDAPSRHPASLRLAAAASVRAGVDREVALRALTSTAASIAGVSDRLGRLAPGLDADFVLWSGDPLDLTSSVDAVYIDGRLVHGPLDHGASR